MAQMTGESTEEFTRDLTALIERYGMHHRVGEPRGSIPAEAVAIYLVDCLDSLGTCLINSREAAALEKE